MKKFSDLYSSINSSKIKPKIFIFLFFSAWFSLPPSVANTISSFPWSNWPMILMDLANHILWILKGHWISDIQWQLFPKEVMLVFLWL